VSVISTNRLCPNRILITDLLITYRVAGPAEEFRFVPAQFDPSDKTFLGKTGPWRGDQVIDIILSQPQCAKFIAAKIWRFFAYEDPAPPLVDALADQLLRCNYEPKPFMKIMLSSQEFFSSQARKSIIKSPVQFLVQGQRTLGLPLPPGQSLVFSYRQLPSPPKKPEPQVIPSPAPTPPTRLTTGFPAGRFVSADDRKDPRRVVEKLSLAIFQATPDAVLLDKFEKVAALNPVPFDDHAIRDLATLMMTTPSYQLC
jgi:Protein of unknown function (DUF1800)